MQIDVVFPVFNNLDVLRVTLPAICAQDLPAFLEHEVIVVDDGSGAVTKAWLAAQTGIRLVTLTCNKGRAAARNAGMRAGTGEVVVFLDSDVIVRPDFLACHARTLGIGPDTGKAAFQHRLSIGRTRDIHRLELPDPAREKRPHRGLPHFTSANVGIARVLLEQVQETVAGPFDEASFGRYGWEDLELERRLARFPLERLRCPAVGYHYCPPFSQDQMRIMLSKEMERAAMARVFYSKHPDLHVRLITQNTRAHGAVWRILSLGGLLNERSMRPLLTWLVARSWTRIAASVARVTVLNPTYMRHLRSGPPE